MADNAGSTFLLPSIDQIVSAAPNHNDASANNMKYSKRINTPTMEHPSQGDNPGMPILGSVSNFLSYAAPPPIMIIAI